MAEQRRGSIAGAFAWRLIEMLESPAHRALSLSARKILDRLEIEFHRHGGKPEDNGRLPCTFDHFVEFGIHRHAIGLGIREVVALGFVEITRKGCAGTAGYRQSTLYHLNLPSPESEPRHSVMRPLEKPAKGAKPSLGETGITPRELAAVKAARGAAAAANLGAPAQDPNRRRGFGKLK